MNTGKFDFVVLGVSINTVLDRPKSNTANWLVINQKKLKIVNEATPKCSAIGSKEKTATIAGNMDENKTHKVFLPTWFFLNNSITYNNCETKIAIELIDVLMIE